MLVLGINGGFGGGYQDVSAVLIENGKILAAVEEERLNRIKHSKGQIPYLSIKEVLKLSGKQATEINIVAFHGATWGDHIKHEISDYFISHFGVLPEVQLHHHHKCHAASVFYLSPFKKALVITADNSGDGDSLHIYSASKANGLSLLKSYARPISFGVFYSLFTQYCGFQKDKDEFKLMALAALGKPNYDLSFLLDFKDGELFFDESFLVKIPKRTPSPTEQKILFNDRLNQRLGIEKALSGFANQKHYDLAASAQLHLENIFLKLTQFWVKKTNHQNFCFAGGVALNGKLNGKLSSLTKGKFYTNFCSNDAGVSLGAAMLSSEKIVQGNHSPFFGRSFSNVQIQQTLESVGLPFSKVENPSVKAKNLILQGKVIGLFSGKSEFGPRALGNRSILANPFIANAQKILNQKIKFREGFRPFGIMIRKKDLSLYFETDQEESPFMNIVFTVKKEHRKLLKEVMHQDGTIRVQTVENDYPLLDSELPFVINTSFNHNKEPIVYSPIDAIRTFFGAGLDYLLMEDFLVAKPGQNA